MMFQPSLPLDDDRWDRNLNGDAPRISTNYDEDDADDEGKGNAENSSSPPGDDPPPTTAPPREAGGIAATDVSNPAAALRAIENILLQAAAARGKSE